jgi:hypothetical protein
MRTTSDHEDIGDPAVADAPVRSEDLRPGSGRRIGTLAFFGLVALTTWYFVAQRGDDGAGRAQSSSRGGLDTGTSALPAGTYRLPGVSTAVSVTLPDGWSAGESIWGPAGSGVAAVSTGKPGAQTSFAVFDLARLRPFGRSSSEPLSRPGDRAWYARWLDDYRSSVEPRVHDRVIGRRLDWRPPAVLAWLLAHTDRRPIDVADDVTIGNRRGDLVSFTFPGPASRLFDVGERRTIALRPDIRYTFWVPRDVERSDHPVMLGIARELGAVPGSVEWDIVRTIELGT